MHLFSRLSQKLYHFRTKDKLITILWITFIWSLIALFRFFEDYIKALVYGAIDSSFSISSAVFFNLVAVVPGAILTGASLVFIWESWLRKVAYTKAVFFILLFYTLIFIVVSPIGYFILVIQNPDLIIDGNLFKTVFTGVFNLSILPSYIFWLIVTFLAILFLLIRDKFGPNTFINFLKGKYLIPKREERIFMFMDLKSSTSIAEKLGEERYFNFLNDTYSIATPGILLTQGEIYQYVGDEIVISWMTKKGITRANCINCYYEMIALLSEKSDFFEKKYGEKPQFKAGLHFGNVITGEMGIVKREIVYSGDVLNTASRIQALCNEMDAEILISAALIEQIDLSFLPKKIKYVGNISLRGKQEKMELVTLVDE